MASADVVAAVVEVATGAPLQGARDFAGPEVFRLHELGRLALEAGGGGRTVVTDDQAGVFAAAPGDVPTAGPGAHLATLNYRGWLQKER
jgi:hypothetical protein